MIIMNIDGIAYLSYCHDMVYNSAHYALRHRRSLPLPVLLRLFDAAGVSAEERIRVLEWIAFEQVITIKK